MDYYVKNTVGPDGTSCHPEAEEAYMQYYEGVNKDGTTATED